MDLWAEFDSDFGELGRYITRYAWDTTPDKTNGQVVFHTSHSPVRRKIYDKISDITISMRAKDYLKLPLW